MARAFSLWPLPVVAALAGVTAWHGLRQDGRITPAMAVHAGLMIASWSVLIPAGGVIARYFKVTPGQDFPRVVDNLVWWHWHRALQYSGIVLSTGGVLLVLLDTGGRFGTVHGRLGLAVMAIGWIQVLSAWSRGTRGGPTDRRADRERPETWRGDHYDMTLRRRLFEHVHKRGGWAAIGLADVAMLLGAGLAGSPGWLMLVLGLLHGAMFCAVLDGVLRGRWVDTYTALWGMSFVRGTSPVRPETSRANQDASARAARPDGPDPRLPA